MAQKLRQTGATQKATRDLTGISERTIRRIEQEPAVSDTEEKNFRKSRKVGRPSRMEPYENLIREWLKEPRYPEDGPLKSIEVYTRLKAKGYSGGKSAVYDAVRRLRPSEPPTPIVRFEGLPGEFSQHDFGQRRVTFEDGSRHVIRFFASRLKYSRTIDVQLADNEQQETVVRCLLGAFERFGGVPLKCVFDNLSAAVNGRIKQAEGEVEVIWTQRFSQLVMDCGFIPVACWPYRPQQKGSVENLVGFVKGNFFCGRKLRDWADVAEQLSGWLDYVNHERVCDATQEIPAQRLLRESLRPCAHKAETYAFKVTAVVRPTARVHYRGLEYSVPAQAIGQSVTLHLQQQRVQVYLGERLLATHPRFPENGRSSVLGEHAEQLFGFRRGKPYAQRQLLLDLDPLVEPYLTELVHRRPNAWEADIDKIYQLYRQLGQAELLAAIALASEERCFGSEYLVEIAQTAAPADLLPIAQASGGTK
ncbi:IS21 family transposase [Synechococcus sp. PCC 7336]|uniref:IS21 family transposase n=1 Tax=Synechococcus sp. PCC 7336 TaxID=195250 RepID=UPI00034DBD8C|nr:IS21 family transposase [Synechococcus sp. PCC 7336]